MSNVVLEINQTGLEAALSLIQGIENAPKQELADGIGRLIQERTRERIEDEKTTPEGQPWKPNTSGTSILYRSGALAKSINYQASPTAVMIGSALVYARIHQLGGTIRPKTAKALAFMMGGQLHLVQSVTIPARKYLGLSARDQEDIVNYTEAWMEGYIR